MQPFDEMRLIKVLQLFPYLIHKLLVVAILVGLAVIGGLIVFEGQEMHRTVSKLEEVRRAFTVILTVLLVLGRVLSEVG